MMLLRANSSGQRLFGVRRSSSILLCEMLNRGVIPYCPRRAVWAQAAILLLAHLHWPDRRGRVHRRCWLAHLQQRRPAEGTDKAIVLQAKETISLINGRRPCWPWHLGAAGCGNTGRFRRRARRPLLRRTERHRRSFRRAYPQSAPHSGQIQDGREPAQDARRQPDSRIAPRMRPCAGRLFPALHSAGARRSARYAGALPRGFEIEANSAVDNPLVFITDAESSAGDVVSGGNFHGEPLAFALDFSASL